MLSNLLRRAGLARPALAALVLAAAPGAAPAAPSPRHLAGPSPIAPAAGAVVAEGALRFAWRPPAGATRHFLLVSRAPFTAAGRTTLPDDPEIQVREVPHPAASLADAGLVLEADAELHWAAAGEDVETGWVWISEPRAVRVVRRFAGAEPPARWVGRPGAAAATAHERSRDRIRLAAGYELDPRRGADALPEALRSEPAAGGVRAHLVYFGDADPDLVRARIAAGGGAVAAYVPDRAFLVRSPAGRRPAIATEGAWVSAFRPEFKLSPSLERSGAAAEVRLLLFADGDLAAVAGEIESLGGRVVETADGVNRVLRAVLPGSNLASLAAHEDVMWIEPDARFTLHNADAQWVTQTFAGVAAAGNRRVWDQGIRGEGQVIMTSDSGLETNHHLFQDPARPIGDFGSYPDHRKVIAYQRGGESPQIAFGDQPGAGYHGTHTAGTAAGNDDWTPSGQASDGLAKGAKLWFMDLSGPALGIQLETFADLNDLFLPSYVGNAGGRARIASNSWGSAAGGAYDLSAMMVDQFMWNHPDYLICFSNGNSGAPQSVTSPAIAKSVVSVGGTRNGTSATLIYNSTSRGPTLDGRRKPTVCAPASALRSSTTPPSNYGNLQGTSMASPCAAATAALYRQYLTEGWYPTGARVAANGFEPSAALLKAMLVNSGSGTVSPFVAPDHNIGFGRINADSVLHFAGDARRLLLADMTAGLGHGQAVEYEVRVTDATQPLEVTLCWTDHPGNPVGGPQLVNNLDLVVTDGTTTYRGNAFNAQGVSVPGVNADAVNVEEAVRFTAAAGLWTIRVEGRAVPLGPQPFALVVTGAVGTHAGTVALDRADYGSAATVEVRVTDADAGAGVTVRAASTTEPAGETVALAGSAGVYTGSIPLSPFLGEPGDGTLQVSSGDRITVTYQDASPAATLVAWATVSFDPPRITGVSAAAQGGGRVVVSWSTDRNATSRVYYGPTPALGSSTPLDPTAALLHQVVIDGLVPGQTYYYDVESRDLNGHVTRDDRGGQHYRVTPRRPADVLLVVTGAEFERADRYARAFSDLGVDYDLWTGPASDRPLLGDRTTGMRSYTAVWWQVGLEAYPPFSDAARDSITRYLEGGGRLAVVGHDVAWTLADVGSPYVSPARIDWLRNTLHTIYRADPASWTQVLGVAGDSISGSYPTLPYAEHRVGASGDEVGVAPGLGSASLVWRSGDGTPDTCGFRWTSAGALGTPAAAVWGGQRSRLATLYFEWSGLEPQADPSAARAGVLARTLEWLVGRARPGVDVAAIPADVTSSALSIAWTESADPAAPIAARRIEVSTDGGESWSTITAAAGPSPYVWDLTAVPNTLEALVRVTVADSGTPPLEAAETSNRFAIRRAGGDAEGPVVVPGSIGVTPNPIVAAATATLVATVSDSTTGGGPIAAAEWSSGDAPAPPGAGTAMGGSFGSALEVPVSATLPAGTLAAGVRTLHVRARDAAGNWGAARSLAVVVNDASTPVLLALFHAAPLERGIEVRWRLGDPRAFVAVELQRAAGPAGPWAPVAGEEREEDGVRVLLDAAVEAGATWYYRLRALDAAGAATVFGPIAATAGRAIRDFALLSVAPNPAAGRTRVEFAVPREAPVRLGVVDVQGREVARLADGLHRPGRYQAAWSGEDARGPLPAGVYFVVFTSPAGSQTRRVVLSR